MRYILTVLVTLTLLTSCQKSEAETVPQYDIVQIGRYQQDGQTAAPINWVVLKVENDRVLLMSRDLLSSRSRMPRYTPRGSRAGWARSWADSLPRRVP